MKALWSGNLVIGFITVPVKMYLMERESKIDFRLIHRKCGTPIKYKKWCPTCNREVSENELVRGVKVGKDEYVILEDEELEAMKPKTTHRIEIDGFINLFDIDPHFFNNHYVLVPNKSEKSYSVLIEAMKEKSKAAIGRVVIRGREFPVVIYVYDDSLVLTTLYYPEEIEKPKSLINGLGIELVPADRKEIDLAKMIIEEMTTKLDLERYQDRYREAIMDLVKRKMSGELEVEEEISDEEVKNLMDALEATVKALKKKKKVSS